MSAESDAGRGISAALDRYQQAKSAGSRRDILATLTANSPQRALLAGSDEDFAATRAMLDDAQYREEFINRRDYEIAGDTATLRSDHAVTRSDRTDDRIPSTAVTKDILIEAENVDGAWLIHDVVSPQRQIMREIEGR
ncbi:hypothetical protein [Gordonia polyisoprenivorans]|uniref:hypothetical protein n=1 Tax=Gordonia polyisoprenivorans TaxID=84595 RepID=UPI001AD79C6E|nr:hypothetical protein [Gordonia polyisoprenivorans]QTI69416.1 hypothetical protein J6U32_01940 [Gordonia polyisoprenivorans]